MLITLPIKPTTLIFIYQLKGLLAKDAALVCCPLFSKDQQSIYMSFYIAVVRQQCSPIAPYFAIIMLRMLIHMTVYTTFATFLQRKWL